MKTYPTDPNEITIGQQVEIMHNGKLSVGKVVDIITKQHNFLGIKVKLDNGDVGRITSIKSEKKVSDLEVEFIQDLKKPEDQMLEFKASFLLDLKEYEKNQNIISSYEVVHSVAKTIAAFSNADGGKLYIGVNDADRAILGLDHDYDLLEKYKGRTIKITNTSGTECLKLQSNGEFPTALKWAMDKFFHTPQTGPVKYHIDVFTVNGKKLCLIKTPPSKNAVILYSPSKTPEFYVRHNDHSERYENITRFCKDWCDHLCELPS